MWRDADLFGLLCLDAGKDYRFSDVWRAAFGMDTWMALFVGGMIGPSYLEVNPTAGGYEDHEYDGTAWRLELAHSPMSSDTLCGSVFPSLVMQTLSYEGFGGMDRQCKVFLTWKLLRAQTSLSRHSPTPWFPAHVASPLAPPARSFTLGPIRP